MCLLLAVTFTQGIRDSRQFLCTLREQPKGKSKRSSNYLCDLNSGSRVPNVHLCNNERKKSDFKLSAKQTNKQKNQGSMYKTIYTNPKQFCNHRHKTRAALTELHLLEHCSSSFPETDLSQATQRAAPDGETGTNWCPLTAPPAFSFPSFTSFTFT